MAIIAKRTTLTLYTNQKDPYSHQVRIAVAEKGVNADIHQVASNQLPEDLIDLNPYNTVPTLVDRELALYEARIILEYLDERFPHPPLLPVYPVARAEHRKMMFRIDNDWYSLIRIIEEGNGNEAEQARQQLLESLLSVEAVFADKPFFLSDEFSILDCCIAPLLWRLPQWGIEIPDSATAIKRYAARVFERPSFQASLTDIEREVRAA